MLLCNGEPFTLRIEDGAEFETRFGEKFKTETAFLAAQAQYEEAIWASSYDPSKRTNFDKAQTMDTRLANAKDKVGTARMGRFRHSKLLRSSGLRAQERRPKRAAAPHTAATPSPPLLPSALELWLARMQFPREFEDQVLALAHHGVDVSLDK